MGNVLLHHGRVDYHAPQAGLIDRTEILSTLNGLGHQPFATFVGRPPRKRVSEDELIGGRR